MTIPDWLRLRTAPGGARQPTGEVFLPLTAQQALEARREALALAEDEGALALCANACLVARGVRKRRRPFPSGKAVLAAYGPEEIEALARRWAAWNQREGLGPDLAPGRLEGPVSYTHLEVYKRQDKHPGAVSLSRKEREPWHIPMRR